MDGGAWWAAVHGVAKSWTQLSDLTLTFHFHALKDSHSSGLQLDHPGVEHPLQCSCLENPREGGAW